MLYISVMAYLPVKWRTPFSLIETFFTSVTKSVASNSWGLIFMSFIVASMTFRMRSIMVITDFRTDFLFEILSVLFTVNLLVADP